MVVSSVTSLQCHDEKFYRSPVKTRFICDSVPLVRSTEHEMSSLLGMVRALVISTCFDKAIR